MIIAPVIVKTALVVGVVVGVVEAAAIAVITQTTSITIDPTFWVAFFGFLTAAVTAFFAYKTKVKTEAIEQKVDGAATATLTEMASLRSEISRLQEDRLARADAAPPPGMETHHAAPALAAAIAAVQPSLLIPTPNPVATGTGAVQVSVPVHLVDQSKPVDVKVIEEEPKKDGGNA